MWVRVNLVKISMGDEYMEQARYGALKELIERYQLYKKKADVRDISEETVRAWLNEFLGIFGWNVQDTSQVLQEKIVSRKQKEKLGTIHSEHTKPDYTLVNGSQIKTYLDAKKLSIDIFHDREAAFQVRSYGWSANVPCAFLSNFEQFVIFDCSYTPDRGQEAAVGAIQIDMEHYLSEFETLDRHLYKYSVYGNQLDQLYHTREIEGRSTVDAYFNKILSTFRVRLANELYQANREIISSFDSLNYYVQVILDRIVFIRVCESRGIEKTGLLKEFKEKGFWSEFQASCYLQFYQHYDGAMFDRDEVFGKIKLPDTVFDEFIDRLYYPYPYKFDAIPVRVIARVYEEFLSYALVVCRDKVSVVLKEDYVKTNGAVPTKEFVVDAVCSQTMDLSKIHTVRELLDIKILDPCCGSGVFLVSIYENLLEKLLELAEREHSQQYYFVESRGRRFATVEARQLLMRSCLFGIDYDQIAVEVTKMSLALKLIEDLDPYVLTQTGASGERILQDIHKNIVCGNTLAGTDMELEGEEIPYIKPVDLEEDVFRKVFREKGGFDYVLGNPPYVETKYFKAASAKMHLYLKNHYQSFEGKADLAVLFLERCLNLLNGKGRLGFVIQRRWFKTTYGRGARRVIADGGYLEKLFDIGTNDLFEKRITYVSIMVLHKTGNTQTTYAYVPGDVLKVREAFEKGPAAAKIPTEYFSENSWSPEFYEVDAIKRRYAGRWGTLGENKAIHIRDGIQALWKKLYHITDYVEKDGLLVGKNGFREEVKLELEMVKPVIYNRTFTPLKTLFPDAYCLFPYTGKTHRVRLSIEEIQVNYPYTYAYLTENKERLQAYVECREGSFWHTFTREHNHEWFESPKIIIPMTARDTIATLEQSRGLYMDNSNVWFINMDSGNVTVMKALTMLINSTVFSVFAKSGANPQSGGYYKFNKQFLAPVPVPNSKLSAENGEVRQLAKLYDELSKGLKEYEAADKRQKPYYKGILEAKWRKADQICILFYEMEEEDACKINEVGRVVDRVTGESGED